MVKLALLKNRYVISASSPHHDYMLTVADIFRGFQAVAEYGDVDVFTSNYRPLKATLSGLPDRVFMKMIVCAKTNKVLGLHVCGEDSPEIVQVAFCSLSCA